MTVIEELKEILDRDFGGVLSAGEHPVDERQGKSDACCALELLSVYRGIEWTDDPSGVRCWDLREINDIAVDEAFRTEHLLPVVAAYDRCVDWPKDRQRAVAKRLAELALERVGLGRKAEDTPEIAGLRANLCRPKDIARRVSLLVQTAAGDAALLADLEAEQEELRRVFRLGCQIWLDALKDEDRRQPKGPP